MSDHGQADVSKWHSAGGELPLLPEITFVAPPEPPVDPAEADRRRAWRRRVFGRSPDFDDPPETIPACSVTVLATRTASEVLFSAPLSVHIACDTTEVSKFVMRWPAVSAVYVVDVDGHADSVMQDLAARGIASVIVPPKFESVTLYRGNGEWFLDAKHRSSATVEMPFGHDVVGLVDAVRHLDLGDQIVEVSAKLARRVEVTQRLDRYGIRWRADKARDFDRFDGERAKSAGMSMRMSIENYGWMDLRWSVADDKQKLDVSVENNGWHQLVKATGRAVCEHMPTYFTLTRENVAAHVALIPEAGDALRIEMWNLDDGMFEPDTVRSDDLRAHWIGPARALAKVVMEASRSLIAAAGWDGVRDLWGADAPFAELDRIESWLRRNS